MLFNEYYLGNQIMKDEIGGDPWERWEMLTKFWLVNMKGETCLE